MAAVLVRGLSPETHFELKRRAKKNGRSVGAEIRATLDAAVRPADRVKIGAELAKFGRRYAKELAMIDFGALRDKTPAVGADFSGPDFE
jgi:antitoxin FitA